MATGKSLPTACRQEIDGGSAEAVTLDSSGDVIAAGKLDNSSSSYDFTVIKLSGAHGTTGPLQSKQLVVKDKAGNPSKRKIVAVAKDKTILTPAPGSVSDPTVAGAKVRLLNPGTLESASFVLPSGAAFWQGLGSPAGSKGYRYRDRAGTNGPCNLLLAKPGKLLKAKCLGRLGTIPFTLDEANQGTLTVSIQLGNGGLQCMSLDIGGTVVKDQGTGNPGPRGIFKAKNSPPLGTCPAP